MICVRMRASKLDTSLADIDHRGRSGGQRLLLAIAGTRTDLKPIVEEQGFHLLGKDIAQGRVKRLFLALTSWMKKCEMAGFVLDLGYGIVVLLFSGHELPSIRHRVLRRLWGGVFKEIAGGGNAGFQQKKALPEEIVAHAGQPHLRVPSRQEELE